MKIILPVEGNPPYGRYETGADVRGYHRTNEACGEKGESLEEADGDRGDGDGS